MLDCVGEDEAQKRAESLFKEPGKGRFASLYPPVATFMLSNSAPVQDKLMEMLSSKKLTLTIEKNFPFTDEGVHEILRKSKEGKSMGKDVLTVSEWKCSRIGS